MSGASAGGSECRGLVLKLHLQKHYLLKNYTSRDLEIILDPNETFVELMPKDDPDALRMLRHADAQVRFSCLVQYRAVSHSPAHGTVCSAL
jgi:hypothetical protein